MDGKWRAELAKARLAEAVSETAQGENPNLPTNFAPFVS